MGRGVRRVPSDWQHPKDERGEYVPLLAEFTYNEEEIAEGLEDGWLGPTPPHYGCDVMPEWSEAEATHYQLYENTTEGTPISPIFADMESLCEWAAENATTFADFKASAAKWREMLDKDFVHHQEGNVLFM